jgi:hypothetical protein
MYFSGMALNQNFRYAVFFGLCQVGKLTALRKKKANGLNMAMVTFVAPNV